MCQGPGGQAPSMSRSFMQPNMGGGFKGSQFGPNLRNPYMEQDPNAQSYGAPPSYMRDFFGGMQRQMSNPNFTQPNFSQPAATMPAPDQGLLGQAPGIAVAETTEPAPAEAAPYAFDPSDPYARLRQAAAGFPSQQQAKAVSRPPPRPAAPPSPWVGNGPKGQPGPMQPGQASWNWDTKTQRWLPVFSPEIYRWSSTMGVANPGAFQGIDSVNPTNFLADWGKASGVPFDQWKG